MDWASVIISIFALLISAIVGWVSWKNRDESRKARDYSVMARIVDTIDNEEARKDREYIYALDRSEHGNFNDIPRILKQIGQERVYCIERTINRLDNVGLFLKVGYSKYQEAPDWIWEMAKEIWRILEPFVIHFRKQTGRRKGYAKNFEELYREALKHV